MLRCIPAALVATALTLLAPAVASANATPTQDCADVAVTKVYHPKRLADGESYGTIKTVQTTSHYQVTGGTPCSSNNALPGPIQAPDKLVLTVRRSHWPYNGKRSPFSVELYSQTLTLCPLDRNVYGEPSSTPCATG